MATSNARNAKRIASTDSGHWCYWPSSENTFEFPELGQNAARFLYAVENSIKLDTSSQLRLGSSLSGPD